MGRFSALQQCAHQRLTSQGDNKYQQEAALAARLDSVHPAVHMTIPVGHSTELARCTYTFADSTSYSSVMNQGNA